MKLLRSLLVLLAVITIVAGVLAWTCPADLAYSWLAPRLGPVRLGGISGSARVGHAASLQVFGLELGAVDWELQLASLLSGSLAADVRVNGADLVASGTLESRRDALEFRDTHLRAPARLLAPALDVPALQLDGELDVLLEQAQLSGLWFRAARGTARWRDAGVRGAAQARFGDIEAMFATASSGAISGVVHDLGGPLQVSGEFNISGMSYTAQARLVAREHNPQVIEALQYIGQAQSDGSSLLLIRGQLLHLF